MTTAAIDGASARSLGEALFAGQQYAAAEAAFRLAAQFDPADALAHHCHAVALRNLERWDEAAAAALRAIRLQPTLAAAYETLAVAQIATHDHDAAEQLFREALRLQPESWSAWNDYGNLLWMTGRTEAAAAAFRKTIELQPEHVGAHLHLGMALLKQGDFAAGWREYEWRWRWDELAPCRRPPTLPRWDGSARPKRILLHAEQGLGDALQFCRYAPLVAARGHEVVLEVQPELVSLLSASLGSATLQVVPRAADYPGLAGLPPADAHCPLMSLPLVFGTTVETIPGRPYLVAEPERAATWRERLAGPGLRIGLVWAGNPRAGHSFVVREADARRSLPLTALTPLFSLSDARFLSLQKDEAAAQLHGLVGTTVADCGAELCDFSDTAALVANLDLVICVDTSIAHLAGAMGRPVWLLSRHDGCWRWLEERSGSPWYPTMRIFRQDADRSWPRVIEDVRRALAAWSEAASRAA